MKTAANLLHCLGNELVRGSFELALTFVTAKANRHLVIGGHFRIGLLSTHWTLRILCVIRSDFVDEFLWIGIELGFALFAAEGNRLGIVAGLLAHSFAADGTVLVHGISLGEAHCGNHDCEEIEDGFHGALVWMALLLS